LVYKSNTKSMAKTIQTIYIKSVWYSKLINQFCRTHFSPSIVSFINEIIKLEEGTYAWDGEKWVRQN